MGAFLDVLAERLRYAVSLPERTVRALAAGAGGMTKLLTDTLLPDALRGSTLYRVVVGDVQRFMIERVACVEGQYAAAASDAGNEEATGRAVQRVLANQAIDAVGLLAIHISPLWVFAIASDVASGGRAYMERLTASLREQGLIEASDEPTSIEQLLAQVHAATTRSVEVLDAPPVSAAEATDAARTLVQRYRDAFAGVTDLAPRLDALWARMTSLAGRDGISLATLSGMMSLNVAERGRHAVEAALTVGWTTGSVLGETLLSGYGRTLDDVAQQGAWSFVQTRLGPYVETAAHHFDPETLTWTQKALAWLGLGGRRRDDEAAAAESGGAGEAAAKSEADATSAGAVAQRDEARRRMIADQIRARGIDDARILAAIEAVPREEFVRSEDRGAAYDDRALPIEIGQTISQPYMVAAMTAALHVEPGHRVLEIGTGSGYQTAILAHLAAHVYTVERHAALSQRAAERLAALGLANVTYRIGDGSMGWPEEGPFDRIVVTAAAPTVPAPLVAQLVDGGRLIVPVGGGREQILVDIERRGDRTVERSLMACRFVPLVGEAGFGDRTPTDGD